MRLAGGEFFNDLACCKNLAKAKFRAMIITRPTPRLWPVSLLLSIFAAVACHAHERESQAIQHAPTHEALDITLISRWESRYHIDGRDALDGDSLLTNSVELGWDRYAVGAWYGNSPEARYDELQLSAAVGHVVGDVDFYLSYTHLRFPHNGEHDHEIGTGFVWSGCPLEVEFALDAYYSFEAEGWFAEAALTREWQLAEKLTGSLSTVFGMNQGYVADGHDGANHIAAIAGLSYALSESLSLTTHLTSSWAVDRKRNAADDELLKDFIHGGIGLELSF